MAARDHVKDQGTNGTIGHKGSDGSQINHRIDRYGKWTAPIGENISYGAETPRDLVLALIIDDGISSRSHRNNIFNPIFRMIGIACGPHAKFSSMCVMDVAGGYQEKQREEITFLSLSSTVRTLEKTEQHLAHQKNGWRRSDPGPTLEYLESEDT